MIHENERLSFDLEEHLSTKLHHEVKELKKISSEIIKNTLQDQDIFKGTFPKKCFTCETIYHSRKEYLEKTLSLAHGGCGTSVFGIQEYRNCKCGSTLLIRLPERRDNTDLGEKRRKLFNDCLQKLNTNEQIPDFSQSSLRLFFRKVIHNYSFDGHAA